MADSSKDVCYGGPREGGKKHAERLMCGTFMGYNLVGTTAFTTLVPRRTHRKRRINKKWLKRYGYKRVLNDNHAVIFGNNIYATPKMCEKLIAEIMKGGK